MKYSVMEAFNVGKQSEMLKTDPLSIISLSVCRKYFEIFQNVLTYFAE